MKIFVTPEEMWNYFQKHKKRLVYSLDEVASSDFGSECYTNIKVFITNENGCPQISVECDNEVLEVKRIMSKEECLRVARKIFQSIEDYETTISDDAPVEENEPSEIDEADIEKVTERHEELLNALEIFLCETMGMDEASFDEAELEEILDTIEVMLFESYGYLMYHPQIVEGEDGQLRIMECIYEEE